MTTESTMFKATAHHLALADEMFDRRARNGQDYPGHWRRQSVRQMHEAGLLIQTVIKRNVQYYYFSEAGYAWYMAIRPEKQRTETG